jgi:CIC family chloride channel protein
MERAPRRRGKPFAWLPFQDLGALVESFNLRRVYYWLLLASLVGLVAGLGALSFKWLTDEVMSVFWPRLVSFVPPSPGGEPSSLVAHGPIRVWGLVVAPMIGGVLSAVLVYRFAPEAAGHGTDAAIRSYHREGGRVRWVAPIVKLFASALTLGSGGSAGREGPIAQIGAGFGSVLGTVLHLSERERRVLLMTGVGAGIGAIFRAPFAGAIFAAEVLYREPDIEAEVIVPSLLASIVSYTVYCAVHGFGHLFTGTTGFSFAHPTALVCYAALGIVISCGGIAYASLLGWTTRRFLGWRLSSYAKPAIGGLLVGVVAAAAYLVSRDTSVLAVMGSGYGTLQSAVSETGAAGPTIAILGFVALGKMLTTSLTIGSGGSGGLFGPSMAIGGCLGAAVGTVFHAWLPTIVPNVGPFAIVGMAGFFAGVAKTPISTLLMVGELTGNYALLLPSMLVVCLSTIIVHRWTIYTEQVKTRADSPAHRDEVLHDVLAEVTVGEVVGSEPRPQTVPPAMTLREVAKLFDETPRNAMPVVAADDQFCGVITANAVRAVLAEDPARGLVVARDFVAPNGPKLETGAPVARALELLALPDVDVVPVVSADGVFHGVLDRRAILGAYRRRIVSLLANSAN